MIDCNSLKLSFVWNSHKKIVLRGYSKTLGIANCNKNKGNVCFLSSDK